MLPQDNTARCVVSLVDKEIRNKVKWDELLFSIQLIKF